MRPQKDGFLMHAMNIGAGFISFVNMRIYFDSVFQSFQRYDFGNIDEFPFHSVVPVIQERVFFTDADCSCLDEGFFFRGCCNQPQLFVKLGFVVRIFG